ncbi:MAG: zinc ribbon domain-containing protein [Isosphaeraceae bacterium]|nr:zinc ribbon domain-containing protein [Isosphaeraceae bacterium]
MTSSATETPTNSISPDLVKEIPHAVPCPHCAAPLDGGARFCPNCGQSIATGVDSPETAQPPAKLERFRCKNCSADVVCAPESRTTACPFCAAPYVIETTELATGRREPEFVIGFQVTPEKAEKIYREWIDRRALFRPSNLRLSAEDHGLRGIYLPFWSFTTRARSRWSAMIGEYWYRTETYTARDSNGRSVVRTRQVREIEWWPIQGEHHDFHGFFPVSASKGLAQEISRWIEPFQLAALQRFSPKYLAGWLTEDYSIEQDEARSISNAEFRRREAEAVRAMLPGDTHRDIQVETELEELDSDLILLPIYLRAYRYKGKLYRTLINGQTGRIEGEKPVSAERVVLFVLFWILLIAGIVLLVMGSGR